VMTIFGFIVVRDSPRKIRVKVRGVLIVVSLEIRLQENGGRLCVAVQELESVGVY
jgi:hypothetical protein